LDARDRLRQRPAMRFRFPDLLFATRIFLCAALAGAASLARAGQLVSGPMLGYRAHRETAIWVETRDAKTVELTYHLAGKPGTARTLIHRDPPTRPGGTQPQTFVLPLLDAGSQYTYSLSVDGEPQSFPYPLVATTAPLWEWRSPPPDFSFVFGSCAYINDPPYDRAGEPYGKGTTIFKHIGESGASFMLWGGDNWYYREADFDSASGLWYRASHDRATPDFQKMLASMNHYAAWDDHDYGSNDANKSYEFKAVTTEIFRTYWPSQTLGEPDNPGVYQKFFWNDAAFIVLDNRTHRDDTEFPEKLRPEKTQYGARQMEWLKQSLLQAKALGHFTFKFIVTGGQVITSFGGQSETFDYFRREREEILTFIKEHNITGVVLLSGDVHFTELARLKLTDTQWIYELTSSPFSSGAFNSAAKVRSPDPQRVEGTLVADQNYCVLALSGPRKERVLTIACYDKTNTKRWEHRIAAADLK
jgi:alkaline phosphatase D